MSDSAGVISWHRPLLEGLAIEMRRAGLAPHVDVTASGWTLKVYEDREMRRVALNRESGWSGWAHAASVVCSNDRFTVYISSRAAGYLYEDPNSVPDLVGDMLHVAHSKGQLRVLPSGRQTVVIG